MISVSRNTHMPKLAASRCCPIFSKWCRINDGWSCACGSAAPSSSCGVVAIDWLSNGLYLVMSLVCQPVVVVGFVVHDWNLGEVFGQRRRLYLPLQARRLPGIVAGNFPVLQRPRQIEHWQQVADAEDGSTCGREHIQHLEICRIRCIAARHSKIAKNKLRKECDDEPNEGDDGGCFGNAFRIHAAGNLGPPEMHSSQVGHQHSAHHNKVEMRHDEVGFG